MVESAPQLLHKRAAAFAHLSVALQKSANAAITIGATATARERAPSIYRQVQKLVGLRAFASRRRMARHISEVHSSMVNENHVLMDSVSPIAQ